MLGRRITFRLHITIAVIFVILTLPVIAIFETFTYRANDALIADHSAKFIQSSLNENIDNATKLFNPILSTVRTAATLMRDEPDYFRGPDAADYLHEIVSSNDSIYGAYAAFEDGSFRQVRRSITGQDIFGYALPADARFVSRYLDCASRTSGDVSGCTDRYEIDHAWGEKMKDVAGPANYDPRTRDYYKDSFHIGKANISDPYVFASSGELGITVSAPVSSPTGKHIGVIAVDVTLKRLSQFLSENRMTQHSISIIADDSGGIVAHPQFELGLSHKGGVLTQNRLDRLDDDRVLGALATRMRSHQDRFKFRAGPNNTEYIAIFAPFPKDFNKSWQVLIITPTNDFVGSIRHTNRLLLVFSGCAFLMQLFLIYLMSRWISRPIVQLANDVTEIRDFRFDRLTKRHSHVDEIRYLSESIDLLQRALQSFTSYVPRGLVRQLLASGVGTRLGVESRYLTVFFTDLESFSTLSETEPSQQLLAQVTDYFATVTDAIERSTGTVDKFIGDAVMAFWGAPNRIENHAYLACVAAVRAHRRMVERNRTWVARKLPPLNVRIGIHTDAVLVGNVGSPERLSYTVMGDGVNIASRLEGINKEMGTWVCVSHHVFREAGERLCLRPIDEVTVKGRKGGLLIYELLAIRDADPEVAPSDDELALCEMTKAAYGAYASGNLPAAAQAYADILVRFADDPVASRMLRKCRRGGDMEI